MDWEGLVKERDERKESKRTGNDQSSHRIDEPSDLCSSTGGEETETVDEEIVAAETQDTVESVSRL